MNEIEKTLDVLKRLRIATATSTVDGDRIFEPLSMAISALEKQQSGEWVPASERLPSEEECNRFDIMHPNRRKFYCTIKIGKFEPQVRELYFSIFSQWEYYSENYDKYVIAWQPLPEPFKEVENE